MFIRIKKATYKKITTISINKDILEKAYHIIYNKMESSPSIVIEKFLKELIINDEQQKDSVIKNG